MGEHGLFDGFEDYLTPSTEDYHRVFTEGLVVLDTNSLLNLYRYTEETRQDLLLVLGSLGEALWIPHQVATEFWERRVKVLRDRPRDAKQATEQLNKNRNSSLEAIRTWANRVSLPDGPRDALTQRLQNSYEELITAISQQDNHGAVSSAAIRNTADDPVLTKLGTLLQGRVGTPFDAETYEKAIAEASRRKTLRLPPGYMDDHPGDHLIWEQTVLHATQHNKDVAFVTGDVKEDWWHEESGEKRGPRLELCRELRARAKTRLFILRPASLLVLAKDIFNIDVREQSVLLAERVDERPVIGGEVRQLIARGEYRKAEEIFDRLIAIHPTDTTLYIGRAQARYGLGKIGDAFLDLDAAAQLDPNRTDVSPIREAMIARNYQPRSDFMTQASVSEFIDRVRAGDIQGAETALIAAKEAGLKNPAYLCINHTILQILQNDSHRALEHLRTLRPPYVGPYVNVVMEGLALLAVAQSGVTDLEFDALSQALDRCGDFEYRDGPLSWIRNGLIARSSLTPVIQSVFEYFDQWRPPQ